MNFSPLCKKKMQVIYVLWNDVIGKHVKPWDPTAYKRPAANNAKPWELTVDAHDVEELQMR